MVFAHPYAAFLHRVQKPSRYVGGEYHAVIAPPPDLRARVCLAFPDVYDIGMSHLGTKILYSVLNKTPGIFCERVFAPWPDMEAELRQRGLPALTLETATSPAACDVIGFSLQYELTYTNLLNLLDLSGLPLRATDRGDDAPLVLAGGPTATHPEPLAPFIDAFFIGEAEEALPPLCLAFAELRRAGVPRRERLARLAAAFPLYVPELYDTELDAETGLVVVGAPLDPRVPARPKRAWVADINRFPFPDDSPLPYAEAIFDRMAVEIARGCTEGCRFCQAGMIYRPVRERDPVAVIDALVEGARKGGYDETSLTSLSTADYSCVTPLVKAAMGKLRDEKVSLSVSSLRAYGLNDDLLAEMATMKAQGLTFAPEAGTQRMRDVIAKNVTEEDIASSARSVFGRGYRRMKLYFMIGLPTEEDADVRGIVETAARVRDRGRAVTRTAEVTASVSIHVPKPHTPFQWVAMDGETEIARKQALLADEARRVRLDLRMHDGHQSRLEAIFSRGDRRCAGLLERAFRLGCRFDGWDDELRLDLWDRAIADERAGGFDPERYLGTIPITARLPWDHIDIGLEPGFLLKEYRKALKDRLSPPCGKPYKQLLHASNVADATAGLGKKLVCYDCGIACDLDAMKQERLVYLRRMNAWTGDRTPGAPGPAPPRSLGPRRPTVRIEPRAACRFRFGYTKLGRAVYLGHLDLVRHLPRVFRRAGVELAYSAGFHPRPDLSFGPALALGLPSLGECLEAKLVDDPAPGDLLERLNAVTLDGVRFVVATKLADGERSLGRAIRGALYAALLPGPGAVAAALDRWNGGAPLVVLRASEARGDLLAPGRPIDVRRRVRRLGAPTDEQAERLRVAVGWPRERALVFETALDVEGGARPREILAALHPPEVAADPTTGPDADLLRLALRFDDAPAGGAGGVHGASAHWPPPPPTRQTPAGAQSDAAPQVFGAQ